jgi:RluA family pseudouridine synthase
MATSRSSRPTASSRPSRRAGGAAPGGARRGAAAAAAKQSAQRSRTAPILDKGAIWVPGPGARTIRHEAGMDLAHFLVTHGKGKLSVRAARRALEDGCCRVNGRVETFGSYALQKNDVVEVLLPEEDPEHRFDPRRILHEDLDVLAYDKPPFLPVVPQDSKKSWSLLDILQQEYPDLQPVHRLDADTSGIVLFAKTAVAAERLMTMFRDHAVEKAYLAIVRGHPRDEGLHRSYLVKVESRQGVERWKSGRGTNAREAVTAWKVIERLGPYASLIEVRPKTGRHHQIRLHFSELGYPLYGDRIYGDRLDPVHAHRQMLHACEIHLPHPTSGPAIHLKAPKPADMVSLIKQLG